MLHAVATAPRTLGLRAGDRHRIQAAQMEILCAAAAAEQTETERRVLGVAAVTAGGQTVVAQPRVAALHQRRDGQHVSGVRRTAGACCVQRDAAATAQGHRLRAAGWALRGVAVAFGAQRGATVGLRDGWADTKHKILVCMSTINLLIGLIFENQSWSMLRIEDALVGIEL